MENDFKPVLFKIFNHFLKCLQLTQPLIMTYSVMLRNVAEEFPNINVVAFALNTNIPRSILLNLLLECLHNEINSNKML